MAEHTAPALYFWICNCSPKNHPTQSSHCLPKIYQIKCYLFLLGWFMFLPNHILLLVLETNVAPRKKGSPIQNSSSRPHFWGSILAFRRVNHQPLLTCFHGQQSTNHIPWKYLRDMRVFHVSLWMAKHFLSMKSWISSGCVAFPMIVSKL